MGSNIFSIIIVVSAILLTISILLQARGATLGAGFGGGGELFTARRGADKTLYQISIILAIVFVASIVMYLVS